MIYPSVNIPVPQVLALMVDLEEDPEWPVLDDEVEDADNDRSVIHYYRVYVRRSFDDASRSPGNN